MYLTNMRSASAVARKGKFCLAHAGIADYPTKFLQARDAWVERACVRGEQMTADLADRKPFLPPRSSESPATASAVSASSTVWWMDVWVNGRTVIKIILRFSSLPSIVYSVNLIFV